MVTLLFHYFYNMATSQKILTEKVFKSHMKRYVIKTAFKKVSKTLKDHDEEFRSIDRAFGSTQRRISGLATEVHSLRQEMGNEFDRVHEELSGVCDQISLLISEIRQDRLETHQLRGRVTVLEGKIV